MDLFNVLCQGNLSDARTIIASHKAIFNVKGGLYQRTPLMAACEQGDIDIIKDLLAFGADPNARDINGTTAVMIAVCHSDTLKLLCDKGVDLEAVDNTGKDCLSYAKLEAVKVLIDLGKKIKTVPKDISSDVRSYILEKKHYFGLEMFWRKDGIEKLLERGADPNTRDGSKCPILIHAIQNRYDDVAVLLLNHGANPNIKDRDGQSALIHAIQKDNTKILKMLLDKGANPNTEDRYDDPALFKVDSDDIFSLLLDKGADVNTQDQYRNTPLTIASSKGFKRGVSILLIKGADMGVRDVYGHTAFYYAVQNGNIEIAKMLLDKGAKSEDLDVKSSDEDIDM
jgi:ankyrin repeat protein